MKNKVSDQDVLDLLSSLKNTESSYPSDMERSRRDTYIKQVAAMTALTNTWGDGTSTTGSGQASATSTATSSTTTSSVFSVGKLLETALVVALVAEAGVATYIYRDKIADFFNSILSPNVESVASPPNDPSPEIAASEESPSETPEVTVTVAETPSPLVTLLPAADSNDGNNGSTEIQVTSTPEPNDDPGLHLGQTKQPTKEPDKDKTNKENNKSKND